MKKRIAVIGAGISGISIASILKDSYEVQVFESKQHIGGLVYCDRKADFLYHRVGGHVFNSKNKEVLDWFWCKFDKSAEFIQADRNAKIFYQGRFVGYPIENFLYQLDSSLVKDILVELLEINQSKSKDPMSFLNFEAFLQGNFGKTLYELYFKPYNEKIWKTDLSTVSMQWLEGKLPMPHLLEILTNNINKQKEEEMVHSSFYYPKLGGSQFIVDRLAEGLKIHCSKPLESIQIKSGKPLLFGEIFDDVVYTGDVRKLPDILKKDIPASLQNGIKHLRSNSTSSVLCECDISDLSWLYIPEPKYKAHRIIYTGNFSSTNNSTVSTRSSCTVEFSGIYSFEEMQEELKLLPGNLKAIDFNQEPNSYVIQDSYSRGLIDEYKKYLKEMGIHLLGRFGEWEYYNMDKAMEAAFELKKNLHQKI